MKWWLISAALSWLLCRLAAPVLRSVGVIDRPNARSSHMVPTARGGGIGLVLAIIALAAEGAAPGGLTSTLSWLLGLGTVLAVVSFADDVRPVSAFVRLGIHAFTSGACVVVLGINGLPAWMVVLAWVWLCGYTNAFNFMDGINGLAAMQAIVTGIGTALVAMRAGAGVESVPVWTSLVISGAAAGFLPNNFPRPRLFMGDVGSATLGFLLAAVSLWVARDFGWHLLLPLGLLHANFVLDTGITLIRRIARGDKWHQSHREHFYQRLVRAGWSHARVTLWQAGLQVVSVAAALAAVGGGLTGGILATAAVGLIWLGFLALAEGRFRQAQST